MQKKKGNPNKQGLESKRSRNILSTLFDSSFNFIFDPEVGRPGTHFELRFQLRARRSRRTPLWDRRDRNSSRFLGWLSKSVASVGGVKNSIVIRCLLHTFHQWYS